MRYNWKNTTIITIGIILRGSGKLLVDTVNYLRGLVVRRKYVLLLTFRKVSHSDIFSRQSVINILLLFSLLTSSVS